MTPVLAIPTLGRPHLADCLASIDIPVRLLVVGNGPVDHDSLPEDAWLVDLPHNLGVAASWNLAIKCFPQEPYWLISNDDVAFAPGDLARLCGEMERYGWVGIRDWRAFALAAETVERVGFFDENHHPIYCEDPDYERRCDLAGVPWGFIEGDTTHAGSACLREHRRDNERTYPANVAYHLAKWGVQQVRQPGGFRTPFDRGGQVSDWALDLSRLRDQSWPDDR